MPKNIIWIFIFIFLYRSSSWAEAYGEYNDFHAAWIDIPSCQFIDCTQSNDLQVLINRYHSIDKTKLELLNLRINLLDKIGQKIRLLKTRSNFKKSNNLVKLGHLLEPLIRKKLWYLQEIRKIYTNKNLFAKFTLVNKSNDQYKPIFLINKVLFDFKLPAFWGLYQLEVIDPCHRMLTPYYLKWEAEGGNIPFFLWLENQELSFRTLQMNFFSDKEVASSELKISKGKFKHVNSDKLVNYSEKDKEYIYILSTDKKLFVTVANEVVRHSSLSGGKPVLGAGALVIKDGNLSYIDLESGHYQPTAEVLQQVLVILEELGVKLDYVNLKVMYYVNHKKVLESGQTFMKKYKNSKIKINSEYPNSNFKI
jgi:hypothetical protein